MKFSNSNRVNGIDGAIRLVLEEAGREDMSEDAIGLLLKSLDNTILHSEGEKAIQIEVHRQYGRNTRWYPAAEGPWLIPLPHLRYDALPAPMITFSLQPYLVSGLIIQVNGHSISNTLVGTIGKLVKLMLPMIFLQALLDEDLETFPIVSKDGIRTSRKVPGLNEPLTLPDEFVAELFWILERRSVVSWLLSFGTHGRSLAPQVAGSLLGIQFRIKNEDLPLTEQVWSKEVIMEGLTKMFGVTKAKEMFNKGLSNLKPKMTNEEVFRLILQLAGQEE
jgi:hypothetical protein